MIKAALRRPVVHAGVTHEVGVPVSLVFSELHTHVTLPDGTTRLLPNDSVRWGCVVPGCTQEATYVAPDRWCREHWTAWSAHPDADPARYEKNAWMESERDMVEPVVMLACAVEGHEAGTVVEVGDERLLIVVEIGDVEVQVDRIDLTIECERDGCEEEAGTWHPAYWCRPHYFNWLDDGHVHEGRRSGDQEPGWNEDRGAARPADYPELSPREQWAIDRDLGLLDWDGPGG